MRELGKEGRKERWKEGRKEGRTFYVDYFAAYSPLQPTDGTQSPRRAIAAAGLASEGLSCFGTLVPGSARIGGEHRIITVHALLCIFLCKKIMILLSNLSLTPFPHTKEGWSPRKGAAVSAIPFLS